MKFLADECCDTGLVSLLRNKGYDIAYLMEISPGISDDEILLKAINEKRV